MAKDTKHLEMSRMEEGFAGSSESPMPLGYLRSPECINLLQRVLAEVIGTFFIIFAGCGSVVVNKQTDGVVTFPGICVTWGLIVMAMIYTVGHASGAHFNPAVTIAFALYGHFPWKEVPAYIVSQVSGSIFASGVLTLLFDVDSKSYFGTVPAGSSVQSLVLEMIISFLLMYVVSGVGTDKRANGKLAGLVIGMTVLLNVFVAGPTSGASMNPARSLGPAIVRHVYKGIWVYIVGPIVGTVLGAAAYNFIRPTNKCIGELFTWETVKKQFEPKYHKN